MKELLQDIVDYYYGAGKYDFRHLSKYDQRNECHDAWFDIICRVRAELHLINTVQYLVDEKHGGGKKERPKEQDISLNRTELMEFLGSLDDEYVPGYSILVWHLSDTTDEDIEWAKNALEDMKNENHRG